MILRYPTLAIYDLHNLTFSPCQHYLTWYHFIFSGIEDVAKLWKMSDHSPIGAEKERRASADAMVDGLATEDDAAVLGECC